MRVLAVASVGGVRGAITLAGVLTLPLMMPDGTPFPARDLAIFLAAGVIIFSSSLPTFLMPKLLRGLQVPEEAELEQEMDRARVAAAEAAIRAIEQELHELAGNQNDADVYTKSQHA